MQKIDLVYSNNPEGTTPDRVPPLETTSATSLDFVFFFLRVALLAILGVLLFVFCKAVIVTSIDGVVESWKDTPFVDARPDVLHTR